MTRGRHVDCLALVPAGPRPSCVYLKDGTKVVLRRDKAGSWLEVVPQSAVVPAASPRPASSWDAVAGGPSPLAGLSESQVRPPSKRARARAAKALEDKLRPYLPKKRGY